jgi:hypothetical protein
MKTYKMDIEKDLLQTEVGQGALKSLVGPGDPKKKKPKGNFNRTTKQKDKHQKRKTNPSIWKGFKKCFNLRADGTCADSETLSV